METIKTNVLIIGGGAAGLNAALNLKTKKFILLERHGSNSVISPWNLMVKPEKELEKEILTVGNNMNSLDLLRIFLKNSRNIIKDLKKIGIKFRKSNIGLVPDYRIPGLEIKKAFLRKIEKKKILKANVEKFLIDGNKKIIGVEVSFLNSQKKVEIFFNYLILASGGLGGFFNFITGSKDSDGSILSLCYEAGLKMKNLEFFMFHPFLITDKRLPRVLVSGDLLTKMEYENEKGNEFLSEKVAVALREDKYHHIFGQMTKEFYQQSLRGKIYGKLICSDSWFEKYKKENEFGYIFAKFKKKDLEKIQFHPAFHFSIGGLAIDKNAKTSQKNIYAAGEIAGGLHGSNRIGGLAILDALVFGKIAALDINKKSKEYLPVSLEKEKIGKLGISNKMRKIVWQSLGPVKNKKNLENLMILLKKKKNPTSQEKLLEKITKICLLRKKSIGVFLREDLPQSKKANSSFIINKKIVFEKHA